MLGRDAFRFLILPIAKNTNYAKKYFYIDIFKGKILSQLLFHGGPREKDIVL